MKTLIKKSKIRKAIEKWECLLEDIPPESE